MNTSSPSKFFLILSCILGMALVGVIGYLIGQRASYVPPAYFTDTNTAEPEVTSPSDTALLNDSAIAKWQSLSTAELLAQASLENIYLEPNSDINLSETFDLTGDGISEGIFEGNGGNNGITFILMKNAQGATSLAQQKNKDGSIYPVQLLSVGRVMVQETFKLLPSEHGFYTASLSNSNATGIFTCNTNGVNAYVWNETTHLFEWNQALTAKYTAEVCK